MGLFLPKGRKNYRMALMVDGRRIQESTRTSDKRLAEKILAARTADVLNGIWFPRTKQIRTPLSEFIDFYVDSYSKPGKVSWKDDRFMLRRFLSFMECEMGKGVLLQQITPEHIEGFKARLIGGGTSGARVNRHIASLKCMFYRGVDWGKIVLNPAKKIKLFPEFERTRYLHLGDIRLLIASCSPRLRPIVAVAVLTGLRKSDITGLRWANLDFENNLINLVQGKTNTPLCIEMSEVLATLLKSLPKSPSRPFVFSEDDKPLAGHGWVRDDFQKAVQQAGVAPLQFRDLRRTFGTQQALMGTQEKVIRELLGHKTSWMTQKYIRVVQSMRKDAVDKLGQKIGPIPTQHDATDMATDEIYESDVRQ